MAELTWKEDGNNKVRLSQSGMTSNSAELVYRSSATLHKTDQVEAVFKEAPDQN